MPGRISRITIDRELCIGSAICVDVAPQVFQLDDESVATTKDPEAGTEAEMLNAAEGCPMAAIILFDEDGGQIFPVEE